MPRGKPPSQIVSALRDLSVGSSIFIDMKDRNDVRNYIIAASARSSPTSKYKHLRFSESKSKIDGNYYVTRVDDFVEGSPRGYKPTKDDKFNIIHIEKKFNSKGVEDNSIFIKDSLAG